MTDFIGTVYGWIFIGLLMLTFFLFVAIDNKVKYGHYRPPKD